MIDGNVEYFERRLLSEIERIESRIKELSYEKLALQRQLVIARDDKAGIGTVHRKNSINRALIENRVRLSLGGKKTSVSTARLFRDARLIDSGLNGSTFRVQLHRMKKKGLINSVGKGLWALNNSN